MKTVLVTGAARGIGRATALRLAGDGWHVFAGVRSAADGEALAAEASGGTITPVVLDVTDDAQVQALAAALPSSLGAVVNNAGIVVNGPLEGLTSEALTRQLDVNVVGAAAVTRAVLPALREGRGRIVFVSSVSGRIATAMTGAYNASKFALEGMADSWRLELAPWGIHVSLVEPAMTDTELWQKAIEDFDASAAELTPAHRALYAKHLELSRKSIPRMQKMAKPVDTVVDDIIRALTASRPKARYVVGTSAKAQVVAMGLLPTRAADALLRTFGGVPRKP